MSERTRRIAIGIVALVFAALWLDLHLQHKPDTYAAIAAVAFFLVAIGPWSWTSWRERRQPTDPQSGEGR
jgi:hypothetical protein